MKAQCSPGFAITLETIGFHYRNFPFYGLQTEG